jgi:hypothetical protein
LLALPFTNESNLSLSLSLSLIWFGVGFGHNYLTQKLGIFFFWVGFFYCKKFHYFFLLFLGKYSPHFKSQIIIILIIIIIIILNKYIYY